MFARALILLTAVAGVLADLTVSSPASLIQCQPVLLSWSGGSGKSFFCAWMDKSPLAPQGVVLRLVDQIFSY